VIDYPDVNARNIVPEVRDGIRRIIATYLRARDRGVAVPLPVILAGHPALADLVLVAELRTEVGF